MDSAQDDLLRGLAGCLERCSVCVQLLYCSLAIATGGPFIRGPAGQALLWNQQLRQILTRPSTYLNRIEFKGLGLIPGEAKQLGTINAAAGNGFKVTSALRW